MDVGEFRLKIKNEDDVEPIMSITEIVNKKYPEVKVKPKVQGKGMGFIAPDTILLLLQGAGLLVSIIHEILAIQRRRNSDIEIEITKPNGEIVKVKARDSERIEKILKELNNTSNTQ